MRRFVVWLVLLLLCEGADVRSYFVGDDVLLYVPGDRGVRFAAGWCRGRVVVAREDWPGAGDKWVWTWRRWPIMGDVGVGDSFLGRLGFDAGPFRTRSGPFAINSSNDYRIVFPFWALIAPAALMTGMSASRWRRLRRARGFNVIRS